MVGRIFAGLFGLMVIGFFSFGVIFTEQFALWSKEPGLWLNLFQSFLGSLIVIDIVVSVMFCVFVVPSLTGLFGPKFFSARMVAIIYGTSLALSLAMFLLALPPLTWSSEGILSVLIMGVMLSPGVMALIYSVWPTWFDHNIDYKAGAGVS